MLSVPQSELCISVHLGHIGVFAVPVPGGQAGTQLPVSTNHTCTKGCRRRAFVPCLLSHQARVVRGEDYFWHNKGIIWRNKLVLYVLAIF